MNNEHRNELARIAVELDERTDLSQREIADIVQMGQAWVSQQIRTADRGEKP